MGEKTEWLKRKWEQAEAVVIGAGAGLSICMRAGFIPTIPGGSIGHIGAGIFM